jgi:ABC-type branched-subunit amino acid transport system ATPase component
MTALLHVETVNKSFGGYLALADVTCQIEAGDIHALIGPNGAGKTTLFNVVSGVTRPTSGRLAFAGADYTGKRADQVLAMGIARNFQQVRLFPGLSTIENVMIGCHARMGGLFHELITLPLPKPKAEREARERATEVLASVGLGGRLSTLPSELTLVDQRRLEIARALASRPQLLLLDEPAAGMNAAEVNELGALIRRIRDSGVTILLVEHHTRLVMAVADRVTVLSAGAVIAEGPPGVIQRDAGVIAAYLGDGM